MNSAITTAEAYDQNLIEKDIRLSFRSDNGIISDNGIKIYQNNPNPFSDNTVIGFEVPKAAKQHFQFYDLTGKSSLVKEVNTVKGYNSVRVNNSQLGVTGILFYQFGCRRIFRYEENVGYPVRLNSFCSKEFTVFGWDPLQQRLEGVLFI